MPTGRQQALEVAINRADLEQAILIARGCGRAVFGTMDGPVLEKAAPAAGMPVYFYEPG